MCLISCCIRCSDRGPDTINPHCGMVIYIFTPLQLLCWKTEFSMHCGYLQCRNTKVSCTYLSNCSTCISGSFLTYATLPVVKASRVIISNQNTLVWSASINVLYMLQFFSIHLYITLHYMPDICLQKSLIFFLTCSQWRVAKLCLLTWTHLTVSLSICQHVAVGELLNICSWHLILQCIANFCWPFHNLLNSLEWELFWMEAYPQDTCSVILSVFKTVEKKQVNVSEVFCVHISFFFYYYYFWYGKSSMFIVLSSFLSKTLFKWPYWTLLRISSMCIAWHLDRQVACLYPCSVSGASSLLC
jgi:hypothetical protein